VSAERDRILEQALKHELRAEGAMTPQPALHSFSEGGCVDAETLAAWHDGGLSATEMSAVESHVSTCPRCQSMLGAFARGTVSTSGTVGTPGTVGTFAWWKWALAPIAAGAAAVTLWMIVPEQQQIATRPPEKKVATAVDAIQPQAETLPKQQPASPAAPELAARARQDSHDFDENKLKRDANEDRRQLKDQALKEEAALDQAAGQRPGTAAFATGGSLPAGSPPGAAPQARSENFSQPAELQKSARLAAPLEIATLNPSVGWRVVGDRIERSDDGGKTWTVKRQNSGDGIAAGSAPSDSVCWFVGRGGRVLLTLDAGATFAEVTLPEPLDLASVAAIDARSAMVYSVIGRRFRTEDGGRSWRPF